MFCHLTRLFCFLFTDFTNKIYFTHMNNFLIEGFNLFRESFFLNIWIKSCNFCRLAACGIPFIWSIFTFSFLTKYFWKMCYVLWLVDINISFGLECFICMWNARQIFLWWVCFVCFEAITFAWKSGRLRWSLEFICIFFNAFLQFRWIICRIKYIKFFKPKISYFRPQPCLAVWFVNNTILFDTFALHYATHDTH